jgi:predicted acylesterase/phospholipase RssA
MVRVSVYVNLCCSALRNRQQSAARQKKQTGGGRFPGVVAPRHTGGFMSTTAARRANLRLVPPAFFPADKMATKHDVSFLTDAIALEDAVRADDATTLTTLLEGIAGSDVADRCHPAHLRGQSDHELRAAERFSRAVAAAIPLLRRANTPTARDVLTRLRAGLGETGLMLSGGGKLGNYHIGVVRLLLAGNMLPRIISGSSAGSLIAALVGTRNDAELADVMSDAAQALSEYTRPELDNGMFTSLTQEGLRKTVTRLIPDWTFAEAYAHSGRSINIVAADYAIDGTAMIFNRDDTPDVLVRDAVMASCAVPYIYPAVQISERLANGTKRPFGKGQYWMDGSVDADIPGAWLRQRYGVQRLIASVVNPFELPLLTDPDHHGPFFHAAASFSMNIVRSFWSTAFAMSLPVMRHVPVGGRVFALSKRVLDQRIIADVIIAPHQRVHDFTKLIEHATLAQLSAFITEGERATKARLTLLAPSLKIERALAD